MQQIKSYIYGDTTLHYIENGFSEKEAEAMSWIASQKTKGKFSGLILGSFLAYSWGHWHPRIQKHFPFNFSKGLVQAAVVLTSIYFCDYMFCHRRTGAFTLLSHKLQLNNNIFMANLDSLIENFNVFNRKFTKEEIEVFNDKRESLRVNVQNRNWIYNQHLYTPQQFQRRIKLQTLGPWRDLDIAKQIISQNPNKKKISVTPVNLSKLIDHSGIKFGMHGDFTPGWTAVR